MKKIIVLPIILAVLFSFTSCEEEFETDLQIIENEIKQCIENNNFDGCTVTLLNSEISYYYTSFKVENGFFVGVEDFNGVEYEFHYNLLFLNRYDHDETTPDFYIIGNSQLRLYFSE